MAAAPPPGFTLLASPEERARRSTKLPEGFTFTEQQPTIGQKMVRRVFGTDVDDPIPLTRLSTIITGSIGGGLAGMKAGGTAGAMAGTAVAPGIGTAVGGATGAMLGTAAGAIAPEVLMELGEALGIKPAGYRESHGLSNEQLKGLMEAEVLIEAATGGGIAIGRLIGRDIARTFTGVNKRVGNVRAEDATRYGINMLPVQVGNRRIARGFVSVFGRFPLVAGPIRTRMAEADQALITAFQNLPTRIAVPASMNEVSAEVFTQFKNLAATVDTQFRAEYDAIFAKADAAGITVRPTGTLAKYDDILARIARDSPIGAAGRRSPRISKPMEELKRFLADAISPLQGEAVAGKPGEVVRQSLRAMDQIIETVDEQIASYVKGNNPANDRPFQLLTELRTAISTDMMTLGRGKIGKGGQPPATIGAQLRVLDERFSATVADLFQNATANRLTSVQRRGFVGLDLGDAATGTPVDNLADIIMKGDAPSTVDDLSRMLSHSPETLQRLAATVVDRRMQTALLSEEGKLKFNVSHFADSMGITRGKTSPRYLQTAKLLEASGGLAMKEVETLMDYAQSIAAVEIPDVSTFIARRAGISGFQGAANTILPISAAAGGSAVGSNIGMVKAMMIFATAYGGGKLISHMISNPDSARAIHKVLAKETSRVGRRMAFMDAVRGAVWGGVEAGSWTAAEAQDLVGAAAVYVEELTEYGKQHGE